MLGCSTFFTFQPRVVLVLILVGVQTVLLIIFIAFRRLLTILIFVVLNRLLLIFPKRTFFILLQEVWVQVMTHDLTISLMVYIGLLRCNESFIFVANHISHGPTACLHQLCLSESTFAHATFSERLIKISLGLSGLLTKAERGLVFRSQLIRHVYSRIYPSRLLVRHHARVHHETIVGSQLH